MKYRKSNSYDSIDFSELFDKCGNLVFDYSQAATMKIEFF